MLEPQFACEGETSMMRAAKNNEPGKTIGKRLQNMSNVVAMYFM